MPLYKISKEKSSLESVATTTFEQANLLERKHLQAMLRDNPSVLGEDLLIIYEEFSNWQGSQRRIDLLAIDKEANIVVVELKRTIDAQHELQAIRYAAMVSQMDFKAVTQAYDQYLSSSNDASNQLSAEERLLSFLGKETAEDVSISNTPVILLVAPDFSKELTTTVLWLNSRKLNIKCIRTCPYENGSDIFLDVEQLIPLPQAAEYMVAVREKMLKAEQVSIRRENPISVLISNGVLKDGTRLHLIKRPRSNIEITDDKAKGATFLSEKEVRWDYDGEAYSLGALCKKMYKVFGGTDDSCEFTGANYWALENEQKSLGAKAREMKCAGNSPNSNGNED